MRTAERRHRNIVFTRLAGHSAAPSVQTCTKPTAAYDTDVTGITDNVLSKLQSWPVQQQLKSRGVSNAAALLLHKDPTQDIATAAARRRHNEVWCSTIDNRRVRLTDLMHWLKQVAAPIGWKECKGPI